MAKDGSIASHIAESKAKIEKAVPETMEAERHIDLTQQALERSRALLKRLRDPLQLATLIRDMVPGAPRKKRAALKAKPKSRR